MKREIPRIKLPDNHESLSDKQMIKMIKEMEKSSESVKNRAKVMEDIYKDAADRSRMFNEELESEFNAVVKRLNLPLDREAIAAAGFVVAHDHNEPGAHYATITQHGKPVSRTIKMDDERINSDCITPSLKAMLIKDGVLCEVLDDLQRMTHDASKTLQELLDEPERPDHNCTEITMNPESNKINRVVCLGKEYKA